MQQYTSSDTSVAFAGRVSVQTRRRKKTVRATQLSLNTITLNVDKGFADVQDEVEISFKPPRGFVDDTFDAQCRLRGVVIRKQPETGKSSRFLITIRFQTDLATHAKLLYRTRKKTAAYVFPFIVLGILIMKYYNVTYYWYEPITNIYSLLVSGYILSRFLLAVLYRPAKPDINYFPSVSIVVPVKNDEEIIYKTLKCCFDVKYPRDRLEVIVINDGSDDGTAGEIQRVKQDYPDLQIIDFPVNKGKREGMAAGAKVARGDILVFIDSDSIIRKESLFYLVNHFKDPTVGAVCGHANVYNANENALTKMQEVRYYVAFRVIKAAETVFSAVTCCSGSLSAYRRSYVMDFLDAWLYQKFLGQPATFGDDRSLTNFMLRNYRVLYESRGIVETVVPSTWSKFFKQQLRWKKSWFRESFIAGSFMWYKHPLAALSFYCGVVFPLISPLIVVNNMLYKAVFFHEPPVHYVIGFVLMSLLYCIYYLRKKPNRKWIYGLYFCFVYISVLCWQTYYAILTSRKNHWGTR